MYMFESRRRICGEGGVKRVEMHWQRKLVKEGKRVIKISCVTDPPPPLSCSCEILTPIFSAWRSEVRVRCSATRASAEKREKATSSFLKYSSSYSHERSHAHAHTHTEYSRPQCSLMCVYLLSLLDLFLMNYAGRKQNNPATQLHPSVQTHKEIIIYTLKLTQYAFPASHPTCIHTLCLRGAANQKKHGLKEVVLEGNKLIHDNE